LSITVGVNNPLLQSLQELNIGAGGGASGTTGASGEASAVDAVAIGEGTQGLATFGVTALSLSSVSSIADAATGAGQSVANLLSQLQAAAQVGAEPDLDPSARQSLNANFKATLAQITQVVGQASFDGANLLDGSSPAGITAPAGADGSSITLSAQNLTLGGPNVALTATASLGTASAAASALAQINASLPNVEAALSALQTQSDQLAAHSALVAQASGALQAQAGASDADGARLLALQVQQQLGAGAGSIANQAPQMVLSLFR
jgi:flagellin